MKPATHSLFAERFPLQLRFRTDVERLDNTSINCGDHINCGVEVFLTHASFPCIRKAAFHSRLAIPHHGDREPHQHFLTLAEVGRAMGIAIKLAKISPFTHAVLLLDFLPLRVTGDTMKFLAVNYKLKTLEEDILYLFFS